VEDRRCDGAICYDPTVFGIQYEVEGVRVLVGDVGGTKSVLAVAETDGDRVHLSSELRLPSGAFASLESLARRYLDETGVRCDAASFAVAGPVHGDRSEITNLPWRIDARALESNFGWRSVRLLNDLEAVAWGIPALGDSDLAVLHPGDPGTLGNACVVAAGTGLGEAGMLWDGVRHRPFATEGGHTDFAPVSDREYALLRWLEKRHGHVSWERVVSGIGLRNIFEFLTEVDGGETGDALLAEAGEGDLVAVVAARAAERSCALCVETMELFATLYGREAGNMALKHMAIGGVYLGGGIAPKNLDLLRGPCFLDGFFLKGRMEPLMRRMPVRVILEPHAPLYGAALFLAEQ
jgi:glucokinase